MVSKKTKKTPSEQFTIAIVVAIIGLCGTVIAAFIGYLGIKLQVEKPINATQTAHAIDTPTNITQTSQSTTVPTDISSLFDISILKGPQLLIYGVITEPVDSATGRDRVSSENIDKETWVIRITPPYPTYFEIILTGKSKTPVYVTNRIPIKIISYKDVPEESNIWTTGAGGGRFIWVFSTDVKKNSVLSPDSIVWASYPADMIKRFQKLKEDEATTGNTELPIEIRSFPTSIQSIYLDNSVQFPDFFTISENEILSMGMGIYFDDPGMYTIQPGIEFVVDGQRSIKWLEETINVYVPGNHTLWVQDYQDSTEQGILAFAKCKYTKEEGHVCEY